jgi:hypothetical protein
VKYLFYVDMIKADGTPWRQGVLAQDTVASGVTTPAGVNALTYAYSAAGAGATLQNCTRAGQVDHDTTA